MTDDRTSTYLDELRLALEIRDAPEGAIADVLRQVESHIADTGEDPYESFGSPTDYAKQYAPTASATRFWWLVIASVLLAVAGAWLLIRGVIGLVGDELLPWGVEPVWGVVAGGALLVAWAVLLVAAALSRRARE